MTETFNTGPRSQQVKGYILNYISQNHLKQNDQLPSEAAIAKKLGVSRNTIREAYISLENEGIIVRRHGIGTFVAHSPFIRDSLNEFSPFAQIIHEGGYVPHFETLSMTVTQVPNEIIDALDCSPSEKLRCIDRLVYADQQPAIFVTDYLAPLVEEADLPWGIFKGNMVQFLGASLEPSLHQIRSYIRAGVITPEISSYMKLSTGTPVLSVRSTIYNVDNRPVNFSRIFFNSSIVELSTVRMIRST